MQIVTGNNEGQSDRDGGQGCYDGLLFIGHGEGRKARNNAFQQCMSSFTPYVARFDCSLGMVTGNYWETVTPSPLSGPLCNHGSESALNTNTQLFIFLCQTLTIILLCKVKRQYLLTLQVSRYCVLALHGRIQPPQK